MEDLSKIKIDVAHYKHLAECIEQAKNYNQLSNEDKNIIDNTIVQIDRTIGFRNQKIKISENKIQGLSSNTVCIDEGLL